MTGLSRALQSFAALLAATLSWSCTSEYSVTVIGSERDRLDSLQSGGLTRSYSVHLPLNHATVTSPVVIVFHQAGGDGINIKYLSEFDLEADNYGFLAVYPNASSDWAYGCNCTRADSAGVDDVQFVVDLIDALDADYGINRDSIFVFGFAEGALMTHRLVCEDRINIIGMATVAGTMSAPVAESCAPTGPVPFLMIQGTADEDFPFEGALDRGPASLLAADTAFQFWATNNDCGERQGSELLGTDAYFGFEVYRESFNDCPANGETIMLRLEDFEHGWPKVDFSAGYEIGRFFTGGCCGEGSGVFLPK